MYKIYITFTRNIKAYKLNVQRRRNTSKCETDDFNSYPYVGSAGECGVYVTRDGPRPFYKWPGPAARIDDFEDGTSSRTPHVRHRRSFNFDTLPDSNPIAKTFE